MRRSRTRPTAESLANAALYYLSRYAASEASLRRVLENRLRRATMLSPELASDAMYLRELRDTIQQIIEKHKKLGVLNDAAYAEIKVRSLRREGRSRRAILQKLGTKGISGSLAASALEQNADGKAPDEADFEAALAFAKRRKMGPFRKTSATDEIRRKDFASLARAGFSLDVARRVLQSDISDEESEINPEFSQD